MVPLVLTADPSKLEVQQQGSGDLSSHSLGVSSGESVLKPLSPNLAALTP